MLWSLHRTARREQHCPAPFEGLSSGRSRFDFYEKLSRSPRCVDALTKTSSDYEELHLVPCID